jgi:transposase, IS5 family
LEDAAASITVVQPRRGRAVQAIYATGTVEPSVMVPIAARLETKKGNQWHFGMKAHIDVDMSSGVVHTLTGTAANEADINQTAALLHG